MQISDSKHSEDAERLSELLRQAAMGCMVGVPQWEAFAEGAGQGAYVEAMQRLTRLELPPEEARENLLGIVSHQQLLCQELGRPVSLITATCDYFMHVRPLLRDPILVEVRLLQQREECAYRDELTGLFNRRSFNLEVPREMERFRRFGQPFTLLMLDLDHFKLFNDRHGHSAGDQALRDVSRILRERVRLYDRVVRYGGEEFAIILPQTSADEALFMAERIRMAMAEHHVLYAGEDLGIITISIGVAAFPHDALSMVDLVRNADKALYVAKQERDRVRRYQDSQRSHPRYTLSTPLPFRIMSGQAGRIDADALDMSLGGLACKVRKPLPTAAMLHLVLSDPERLIHLPLQAEVRRVVETEDRNYQIGLSFRLESVEDQMKLMALLEGRVASPENVSAALPGIADA